ncbi:hypothetical protein MNBD_IGNAVI01-3041 [hydrothermal vent metagenome]|uniref:Endonuclease n=1 Tax=hydrothermal vent metagenome TaxID=652676 RepID=A0A3B1CRC2_9ZZZZ
MKLKFIYWISYLLIFLFILSCSATKESKKESEAVTTQKSALIDSSDIVFHKAYSLKYDEEHEQADWVRYTLTKEHLLMEQVKRSNNFKTDTLVKTGSATPDDYKHSGYDRGHLAPAADMSWSKVTMQESFYMSNMSPQLPSFNRGVWKRLEGKVREWAIEYDTLYVVTGPVLKDSLKIIGVNQVSVPEYFYKALLVYTTTNQRAIGFILPNTKSTTPIDSFAVSIDSVESVTGIDFFSTLPDSVEEILESKTEIFK